MYLEHQHVFSKAQITTYHCPHTKNIILPIVAIYGQFGCRTFRPVVNSASKMLGPKCLDRYTWVQVSFGLEAVTSHNFTKVQSIEYVMLPDCYVTDSWQLECCHISTSSEHSANWNRGLGGFYKVCLMWTTRLKWLTTCLIRLSFLKDII